MLKESDIMSVKKIIFYNLVLIFIYKYLKINYQLTIEINHIVIKTSTNTDTRRNTKKNHKD